MKEMTLKDIQDVSLRILKTVHGFCVENGIRYSLAYGTLIGAVRHKGFVPWDDDLDIIMPRPDYDRFCSTFRAQGYQVVSRQHLKDCFIPFARVCDTVSTCLMTMEPWIRQQGDLGVWIDIFPVDAAPDDRDAFHNLYLKASHHHAKSIMARRPYRPLTGSKPLKYNLNTIKKRIFALFRHSPEYHLDAMQQIIGMTPYGSTCHLAQFAYPAKEEYFDAKVMDGYHLTDFEDSRFYVIDRYDELLRMEYGDYMTLPPLDQQKPQQDYITIFWKDK